MRTAVARVCLLSPLTEALQTAPRFGAIDVDPPTAAWASHRGGSEKSWSLRCHTDHVRPKLERQSNE
jgi:hypothetical protein